MLNFPISCGNPKKLPFFAKWNITLNSCHSLDYTHDNKSIICFNDLHKPIETYIHAMDKHPFTNSRSFAKVSVPVQSIILGQTEIYTKCFKLSALYKEKTTAATSNCVVL